MWNMYAQPRSLGVKIALPVSVMKRWIKNKSMIFSLKQIHEDGDFLETPLSLNTEEIIKLSAVAYSNYFTLQDLKEKRELFCGSVTNTNIKCSPHISQFTSYIKDKA